MPNAGSHVMNEKTGSRSHRYQSMPNLIVKGLLAMDILLLLADQQQWFCFNVHKGWLVLMAFGALGIAVLLLLVWSVVCRVFACPFQFQLQTLLLFVLACAIPSALLGIGIRDAEQQQAAVAGILSSGGRVTYASEANADSSSSRYAQIPGPSWSRRLLGIDFFADVVDTAVYDYDALTHVKRLHHLRGLCLYMSGATDAELAEIVERNRGLQHLDVADTVVADGGLEHVGRLRQLKYLDLGRTLVSDTGLEHLKGLDQLEYLDLSGTRISDAGLKHITSLPRLRSLVLYETEVTTNGIRQIERAALHVWHDATP